MRIYFDLKDLNLHISGEHRWYVHLLASRQLYRYNDEHFTVTLHILPIHGPDVVLGLSWLRSLQRVTNDYVKGTIEFVRDGLPVCLKVDPPVPHEVSLRVAASLLLQWRGAGI